MKMKFTKNIFNMSQGPSNPGFRSVKVETKTFLKKDSRNFQNYFYLGFLWIPSKPRKQNWKVPFFWVFIIVKKQCVQCAFTKLSCSTIVILVLKDSKDFVWKAISELKLNPLLCGLFMSNSEGSIFKMQIFKTGSLLYRVSRQLVLTFDFNSWLFWLSYQKNSNLQF